MKRIIIFIIIILLFSSFGYVYAEDLEDVYKKIYDESELSSLPEYLNEETAEIISELGIDLSSYSTFLDLTPKTVWNVIADMLGGSISAPITSFSLALCVILICSILSGMWSNPNEMNEAYSYVCMLSLSSVVLMPLIQAVENSIVGIKTISGFMMTFVPVYGGLLVSSGNISSGAVYQSVMLVVCEAVAQITAFFIAPMIGVFICIGMSAAISGIDGAYKFAAMIKNIANWVLGFIMAFFTGFLSIQGVVGKSADSLMIKTTRFFVGSTVPVVGNYLGEALSTVTAGLGILRSSAMAWCILALSIMVLPIIIELFLWKIALNILSAVSEMFSIPQASKLFEICSIALGFLIAIVLSVSVMFILSLVIIKVGT